MQLQFTDVIADIVRFGRPRLPVIEYIALLFLAERCQAKGSCTCSRDQMLNGTGLCPESYTSSIRRLVAKGLISRTERRAGSTRPTEYTLYYDAIYAFLRAPAPIPVKNWRIIEGSGSQSLTAA